MSRVTAELVIGCALFVILAAGGSYLLARSALKPVERLRAEVSDLSVRDASGTLAVPRTHDEISALASTMNELLVRVRTSLERERSLVADASHELRTPFAILQGELELAQRPGRTHDELMSAVTIAAEEVARLTRLADDLLLLSRSDQGQLPLLPVVVDVREYLDVIMGHADPRITGHRMTCWVDAPSRPSGSHRPGPNQTGRRQPDRQLAEILPTRLGDRTACRGKRSRPLARGSGQRTRVRPDIPPPCLRAVPALGRQPVQRPRRGWSRSGYRFVDRRCPWGNGHRRKQPRRWSMCSCHPAGCHLSISVGHFIAVPVTTTRVHRAAYVTRDRPPTNFTDEACG